MTKDNTAPENAMDYEEHEKTYHLFLALVKWHVYGLTALLILMALFLL
jgi:hypothetical protein